MILFTLLQRWNLITPDHRDVVEYGGAINCLLGVGEILPHFVEDGVSPFPPYYVSMYKRNVFQDLYSVADPDPLDPVHFALSGKPKKKWVGAGSGSYPWKLHLNQEQI